MYIYVYIYIYIYIYMYLYRDNIKIEFILIVLTGIMDSDSEYLVYITLKQSSQSQRNDKHHYYKFGMIQVLCAIRV